MILPSIDLMDGRAVQLVGGAGEPTDVGEPLELLERFARLGVVPVVDLDAALGRGNNDELVREMLRRAPCRLGGGIRDLDRARDWLDAGAQQIVLGTMARPEILQELPRERVIAALDARDGEVVDHGWTRGTGAQVEARMQQLVPFVSGFLVTFVEREGRVQGTDLLRAAELRAAAGECSLTVAGDVSTTDEVRELHRLGIDAVVGMAMYRGELDLVAAYCCVLESDRQDGLWPTVVVDEGGRALGLVYSNEESVRASFEEGRGVYWSRRRGLWRKGESSGDLQELLRIDVDCDADALRFVVRQRGGGFCHLGTRHCWGEDRGLSRLERRLAELREGGDPASYTRRLFADSSLLASKQREEIEELIDARTPGEITHEAADVLYFTLVRLVSEGVPLEYVEDEIERRALRVRRRGGDRKEDK